MNLGDFDMGNPLHSGAAGALGGAALGGLGSLPFEEQRKKWLRNAMLGALMGGGAGMAMPGIQQLMGGGQVPGPESPPPGLQAMLGGGGAMAAQMPQAAGQAPPPQPPPGPLGI